MRSVLTFTAWIGLACIAAGAEVILRKPVGSAAPGRAWSATTADVPLGFTAQILGWRDGGGFPEGVAAQAKQALANLERVLRSAGSDLAHTVKLNFYVTDDGAHSAVMESVAAACASHPVPVSLVRSRLGEAGALVAVDAVVQAPARETALRVASLPGWPAQAGGGHLGILPAGRKVFLSGLASRTKGGLREALHEVLEGQTKTIRHLGLDPAQVVQVKGWLAPLDRQDEVRLELAAFFAGAPIPPVVLIEWTAANGVEIEFVLAGAKADPARFKGPLAFATRPGAEAPTRFSHVALVEAGQPLIFTAGLYGQPKTSGREQMQDIYTQLGRVLFEAGGGFRYLVKATYQNADTESRGVLGEIRDVYYDPARPPAASGVLVHGVGKPEVSATLDMIGVRLPHANER